MLLLIRNNFSLSLSECITNEDDESGDNKEDIEGNVEDVEDVVTDVVT